VAMGVYIPALAVRHQLDKSGINSEVVVLESLIVEEKRNKIKDTKKIFHRDFRVAKKGHEMARDITSSLDQSLLDELFEHWKSEGRHFFIVLSGFWMPVLMKYREFVYPKDVYADLLIVDSIISPSWKSYKGGYPQGFNIIKLFNFDESRIGKKIFTTKEAIPFFSSREDRVVVHGGGWGMGTYQNYIPQLNENGIDLNVVLYFKEDLKRNNRNRYFMVDPKWQSWHKDKDNKVVFPPFGEIYECMDTVFTYREEYNELFYVILKSKGIVSKPGGSSLIDSLASATPMIFLEALGEHEEKNAELWINLGFGITFEDWKNRGFSFDILKSLHTNLLKEQKFKNDYVTSLQFPEGRWKL
jgi:hypothetical protein